jgi:hypothetical protein
VSADPDSLRGGRLALDDHAADEVLVVGEGDVERALKGGDRGAALERPVGRLPDAVVGQVGQEALAVTRVVERQAASVASRTSVSVIVMVGPPSGRSDTAMLALRVHRRIGRAPDLRRGVRAGAV